MINNYGYSSSGTAIYIYPNSENNLLINNTALSDSSNGFRVYDAINNVVIGLNVTAGSYGIHLSGANNTKFVDCLYVQGSVEDVFVLGSSISIENYFINCSYF